MWVWIFFLQILNDIFLFYFHFHPMALITAVH
jgi:hypothetical protein